MHAMVFVINGECDMAASLKFESAAGTAAATLAEVKLVTLADNTDNEYTLDITTNDLKVGYKPNGGNKTEYTVNGLATALGKLLTIDGSTAGKSVLAEKVAEKEVVDALIPELAKDDGATGIYTKKGVDDELVKKANADGSNATDPGVKAMLDKLTDKVLKVDGSNATDPGVKAMLDKLTDKVLKVDGSNATDPGVTAMLDKLTDKVLKVDGSNATDPGVTAMLDKLTDKVLKVDGSNATDPGVTAMLSKLIDANKVLKVDGSNATDPGVTAMLDKLTDKVLKVDGSNATDPGVTAMLDKLTDKVLKVDGSNATDPGVTAMLATLAGNNRVAKIDGSNVEEAGVIAMLATLKGDNVVVKVDGSNISTQADKGKALADAILAVQDNNKKSVLIEKLEGFLAENTKAYSNNTKTAKELLLPPAADLATEIAKNAKFIEDIEKIAVPSNTVFQNAVKEVMSQPSFEIPTSDDVALNWTW